MTLIIVYRYNEYEQGKKWRNEMKQYKSLEDASLLFKALSASMRLRIMEILYERPDQNLNDLAKELNLTNSAISIHMNKLLEADLVEVNTVPGKRGSMKICRPKYSRFLIEVPRRKEARLFYEDEIRIGCYSNSEIAPTCGISTKNHMIGEFDAPKYFQFPEHFEADILWFGHGFVEYNLPNRLQAGEHLTGLEFSMEVSSECPGFSEDYPSDISFYLNNVWLGTWISPGDFGARRGRLNPVWWPDACNQYGLRKTISITEEGVFLDNGLMLSNKKLSDFNVDYTSTLVLKIQVDKDAKNCGGLTIFGRGFGDYDQGIQIKTYYEK